MNGVQRPLCIAPIREQWRIDITTEFNAQYACSTSRIALGYHPVYLVSWYRTYLPGRDDVQGMEQYHVLIEDPTA